MTLLCHGLLLSKTSFYFDSLTAFADPKVISIVMHGRWNSRKSPRALNQGSVLAAAFPFFLLVGSAACQNLYSHYGIFDNEFDFLMQRRQKLQPLHEWIHGRPCKRFNQVGMSRTFLSFSFNRSKYPAKLEGSNYYTTSLFICPNCLLR